MDAAKVAARRRELLVALREAIRPASGTLSPEVQEATIQALLETAAAVALAQQRMPPEPGSLASLAEAARDGLAARMRILKAGEG